MTTPVSETHAPHALLHVTGAVVVYLAEASHPRAGAGDLARPVGLDADSGAHRCLRRVWARPGRTHPAVGTRHRSPSIAPVVEDYTTDGPRHCRARDPLVRVHDRRIDQVLGQEPHLQLVGPQ